MAEQEVKMVNTQLPDILELKKVKQVYRDRDGKDRLVIDDFNLLIEDQPGKGEFVVILGPSGCGKSTILRYVCGLQTPTEGEVLIAGRARQSTDYVGMIFQSYSSYEHYTVLENVALGLRYRGISKKEREAKAMEVIVKVGLEGHEHKFAKYPNLSGGQLQRVAIARSIAYDSRILLMDEPFGALDLETRSQMQEMIAQVWLSITPTIIMVTHDISEAVYLGDTIYVMGRNPGNLKRSFVSPLPLERHKGMKRSPEFVQTVQSIEDYMSSM
jgi:NitT/TauT family transport system ATP-binding protein